MKGCLSITAKAAAAVLIFFGLKYLGIVDFIQDKLKERNSAPQEQQIEKAKDIVDLSDIDEEYTIDKNFRFLKNKIILIQHNASGQKTALFEPKNSSIVTKKDLEGGNLQEKIDNFAAKYQNKLIKFDKIKIQKQGNFKGLEQTIPYVKASCEITNLPVKDIEGILAAAELSENRNIIIISFNEKNKYSQIITEALISKIKKTEETENPQ